MARAKNQSNGRPEEAKNELEHAMATLIQTQAMFVQSQADTNRRSNELERIIAERFARIESILMDHSRILAEHGRILSDHGRILAALPDALRDKIGFKPPQQS